MEEAEIDHLDVHHINPKHLMLVRFFIEAHQGQWYAVLGEDPEGVQYCVFFPPKTRRKRLAHGDSEKALCFRILFPCQHSILYFQDRETGAISLYTPS